MVPGLSELQADCFVAAWQPASPPAADAMKLVIASGNAGKLAEFRSLLPQVECISQGEIGIEEIDETGSTFVENALLKARHAARASGLPALGDDSGLCVPALGGEPGLYSARYAGLPGDPAANIRKLLDRLGPLSMAQRSAYFYAVLVVLRHPLDPQPLIAEGRWPGIIVTAPRGDGGFGYDPVFLDPISGLTAAELAPEAKNRISHRGQAMISLRDQFDQL